MRKLSLLAAAAMVAGGSAFAMDGGGVSISGEANFGVKFAESDDDSKSELQFHHEFKVTFAASGTTDGGIGFGGEMTLDNTESVSLATKPGTPGTGALRKLTSGVQGIAATEGTFAPAGTDDEDFTSSPVRAVVITSAADEENGIVANENYFVTLNDKGLIVGVGIDGGSTDESDNANDAHGDGLGKNEFKIAIPAVANAVDNAEEDALGDEKVIIVVLDGEPKPLTEAQLKTAGWVVGADNNLYQVAAGTGANALEVPDPDGAASVALGPKDTHKVDNHGEVYISMDMHKLTIGSDLDAADKVAGGLADPGFDGIGIDDVAEGVWGKSAADVRYDGDFGVASVAISYGDNKGDAEWAAGFSFNVEPVTMGAGFDSNGVMSIGLGFSQGLISMNALYSTDSDWHEADNEAMTVAVAKQNTAAVLVERSNAPDLKNQAMGVDMTYQMSEATSLVLVAAQHKQESANAYYKHGDGGLEGKTATGDGQTVTGYEQEWTKSSTTKDAFGVGFSHDLGGGATLKAGAGSVDSNAVADLGITMKF
ncbi:MAG: porin [Rhodobacteraceae bacterium]|nr:porin [Paracoccaceae bacterium]MCY4195660.1 porin [Paracoccaceae bacterium]